MFRECEFDVKITHITNGSLEKKFNTKKIFVLSALAPAEYANKVIEPTLGQIVRKRKHNVIEELPEDDEDEELSQNQYHENCKDMLKKRKIRLQNTKCNKKKIYGFYSKETTISIQKLQIDPNQPKTSQKINSDEKNINGISLTSNSIINIIKEKSLFNTSIIEAYISCFKDTLVYNIACETTKAILIEAKYDALKKFNEVK